MTETAPFPSLPPDDPPAIGCLPALRSKQETLHVVASDRELATVTLLWLSRSAQAETTEPPAADAGTKRNESSPIGGAFQPPSREEPSYPLDAEFARSPSLILWTLLQRALVHPVPFANTDELATWWRLQMADAWPRDGRLFVLPSVRTCDELRSRKVSVRETNGREVNGREASSSEASSSEANTGEAGGFGQLDPVRRELAERVWAISHRAILGEAADVRTTRLISRSYLLGLIEQGGCWIVERDGRRWAELQPQLRELLPNSKPDGGECQEVSGNPRASESNGDVEAESQSNLHREAVRGADEAKRRFLFESWHHRRIYAQSALARARLDRLENRFALELQRAKMAAMKELAYGASHEINNPLANISTRAQTLLRDEPDPERRERLAMINSQAFRAHEMISNMMLFAHPPAVERGRLSMRELLAEVVAQIGPLAAEQGTSLVVADSIDAVEAMGPEACWQVEGDATHLSVLVHALIRNAIEALGSGGTIRLSLDRLDGSTNPPQLSGMPTRENPWADLPDPIADRGDRLLRLEVSDDGPGIPAEVLSHVFDPFFSGREAGRGLGFGLAKAWRIVELHGGVLRALNNPAGGATFQVDLPLS